VKIGSLFSGYGGLDIAVAKQFDAEVVWHCEWEDAPSRILEANFPGVPNYRDVTTVDWSAVEPVDILTGGFPCQDVSLAGRRAGMAHGTRSGLWSEFAKAIDVLQPKWVVIENVRGLLSAKADSGVEQCAWCVGEAGDGELFSETWPVSGTMRNGMVSELPTREPLTNDSESLLLPIQVFGTLTTDMRPRSDAFRAGRELNPTEFVEKLLRTPAASEAERGHQPEEKARARGGQVTLSGQTNFEDNFDRFGPAVKRWEQVTGMAAPSPTKPDGKDGAPRLSSEFTEWMMGLPKGWVTGLGLSRKDELKACGNGVVPQQATLALTELVARVTLE